MSAFRGKAVTRNPVHRVPGYGSAIAAGLLLLASLAAAQEATVFFNIPAQAADAALREFARQSGRQILFSYALTARHTTPAIRGRYTPTEAVTLLADAVGLEVAIVDTRTIALLASNTGEVPADSRAGAVAESVPTEPVQVAATLRSFQELEEIIVTAQKRVEAAQQVPVAIDVINGDTFDREGVHDVKDIRKASTELEIDSAVGQATVIGIRGMQQQGFAPTGDTLTAVHMDGAYLSSFWGLNGLMYDLERVEVLAGPQGTLYGRNTAAGAVNLITRRPGRILEANGTLEYGSKNTMRVAGGVSIPVGDTLAMRLAGQKLTRDALFSDGSSEQDQWGARLSGLWAPDEFNELYFTADYTGFNGTNDAATLYAVNGNARLADGSTSPSVTSYLGNATLADPYNNVPYNAQRGLVFFGDNEQRNWGAMSQYTRRFSAFNATLQYSHRQLEGIARSTTRTSTQFSGTLLPNAVTSDTTELHLTSNGEGAFKWVAGLFYTEAENLGWNATPLTNNSPDPVTGLDLAWCPCSSGFFPNSGDMYSYAAYGQTTWTPATNPRLHLTGGLRYTVDWKDATLGYWVTTVDGARPISAFGIPNMPSEVQALYQGTPDLANGDNDRTWAGLQYRLGIEYEFSHTSMVYGSVATGYKSGGLTYGPTPELKPEQLLAFEIGTKNRFLDNTLEVNAAMWWYDYKDLEANVQRSLGFSFQLPNGTFQDTATSTASVGKVNLGGISSDLTWNFSGSDRLGLSFTHVYSRIRDGKEVTPSGQINTIFNEGERLGDAPEWQVLGRYGHTFVLEGGARLDPQLKYLWQSEKYDAGMYREQAYFPDHRNPAETTIPSRGILDFSLRFTPRNARWDLTGYVNNATDEIATRSLIYNANPANAATTYGHTTAQLGDSRIFGIILNTRFQ